MYSDSIIISSFLLHSLFKNLFRQRHVSERVSVKKKEQGKKNSSPEGKGAFNSFTTSDKSDLLSHDVRQIGNFSVATKMKRRPPVRELKAEFEIVIESPFISLRIRDREGPIRYRSRPKGMKKREKLLGII